MIRLMFPIDTLLVNVLFIITMIITKRGCTAEYAVQPSTILHVLIKLIESRAEDNASRYSFHHYLITKQFGL